MNKDFIDYYFGGRSICKTANLEWQRNPDTVRTTKHDLQRIKLGVHKRFKKAPTNNNFKNNNNVKN